MTSSNEIGANGIGAKFVAAQHKTGKCRRTAAAQRERNIDEALAESFPASDPPSFAQPAPDKDEASPPVFCCAGKP